MGQWGPKQHGDRGVLYGGNNGWDQWSFKPTVNSIKDPSELLNTLSCTK